MDKPLHTPKHGKRGREFITSSGENSQVNTPIQKKSNMGLTKQDLDKLRSNIKSDINAALTPLQTRLTSVERAVSRLDREVRDNNIIIHGLKENLVKVSPLAYPKRSLYFTAGIAF
jgi:hypothetical protein